MKWPIQPGDFVEMMIDGKTVVVSPLLQLRQAERDAELREAIVEFLYGDKITTGEEARVMLEEAYNKATASYSSLY